MIKIDIISGFLGAGKTTIIKKLISEAFTGEKLVLIENEFGEIGVDGGFLKDAGIEIKEMNSGCICCSLVGDFETSLKEVIETYQPERIIIEPSGVGKLSDVVKAVEDIQSNIEIKVNNKLAVVNAKKCAMYIKNFGEFFINQVAHADGIVLSRTNEMSQDDLKVVIDSLREHNNSATIITTPWDKITGKDILSAVEQKDNFAASLLAEVEGHHNHDEDCGCGHHHHNHDENCGCGHHHHNHDENCGCGHDHHNHNHAHDVFTSWGVETPNKYKKEDIQGMLEALENTEKYGAILRAKGMLEGQDGTWTYFDYVPGEVQVRAGIPCTTGKVCVIGAGICETSLKALFGC